MKDRLATSSAIDWSPVCPMPVHTGVSELAMARATTSASKAARSALEPPPRTTTRTSQRSDCRRCMAQATRFAASLTLHLGGHDLNGKCHARCLELSEEVAAAFGARTGHQTDAQGEPGYGDPPIPIKEALVHESRDQASPLCGDLSEQGVGVKLGKDEV